MIQTKSTLKKQWDYKMIVPVLDFIMSIENDINPRLKKLAKKDEYVYRGTDIEEKVWKLLTKARRLK